MPQPSESTVQQYLVKYKHPVSTKGDIMNAVKHYRGLQIKRDVFVFDDGTRQELVCLDGTIPTKFRGNSYNIPVCIWLMQLHPVYAPLVYVKPTAEMKIEVSCHVDHNGKVYLPYISDWNQGTSDLIGLIQVMIIVFSETPPVFARPRNSVMTSSAGVHQAQRAVGAHQYPTAGITSYPSTPVQSGYPYPVQPSSVTPYPVQPSGYPSFPPQPSGYPTYPSASTAGLPATYQPSPVTAASQAGTPSAGVSAGTIGEEHIRASLLSAVEDRLRRRLREISAQSQAEMDVLANTERDLQLGKQKIDNIITQLEQHKSSLEERVSVLKAKNEELESSVERMKNEPEIDIDQAVLTTAPLYNQLLECFAEENATQDAIYHLGEALGHNVIDLDTFLKQCRQLSRRQFMLRATIQRCRQRAGLFG